MIDNHFRQILPKFVGPIVGLYKALRLTPNQITLLGLGLSFTSAYLVATQKFYLATFVWWVGRLLDGTDGIYARATGQTSSFGAFLDIVCDMASYSIMIIGFSVAVPQLQSEWFVILFLYVLCITSALALGNLEDKIQMANKDNRGLRLAAGIAEGGETGIAYSLFLIFPSHLSILARAWIIILFTTVFARALLAKRELGSR